MLAIIADVHHGAYWRGRFRDDIIETLRECIDLAIERKVYAFLIAGDLYNSSCPHPDSHAEVIAELDRLNEARISTYVLMGNHDVQRKANSLKPLGAVGWNHINVVTDDYVLPLPSFVVNPSYLVRFVPYRDVQTREFKLPAAPFIGIGHAPVLGGMYAGVDVPASSACIPQDVLDAGARWYIGHIHTPQRVGNVIIPGSIVQSSIADAGQDRFMYFQGQLDEEPEQVKLTKGWKFVKYDLDFVTQKELAKQQYRALLSGNTNDGCDICQVLIRAGLEDLGMLDLAALRKALNHKVVDIPAPIVVRKSDVKLKTVQLDTPRKQAVTEFINAMVPKEKAVTILQHAERIMQQVDRENP